MKIYYNIILLLALTSATLTSNAAEIKVLKPGALFIDGEIEKGDYHRLISVILNYGNIPSGGGITSPGGDVIEAMKIGRFIRKNHMSLVLVQPCDSACAFIVFAAVKRVAGKLGLHRPRYDPQYFSQLTGEDAK